MMTSAAWEHEARGSRQTLDVNQSSAQTNGRPAGERWRTEYRNGSATDAPSGRNPLRPRRRRHLSNCGVARLHQGDPTAVQMPRAAARRRLLFTLVPADLLT
jgi:hypothetical protein